MAEAKLMQKKSFVRSGEGATASYNWTDLADGTGYVTLYPFRTYSTAASYIYNMMNNTSISGGDTSVQQGASAADLDFDITFSMPKVIKGDVYFCLPFRAYTSGTCTGTITANLTIKLYKVVGGVETQIGSTWTGTGSYVIGSASWTAWFDVSGVITLTQQNFKKGETLRFNVSWTTSGGSNSNCWTVLYHDPQSKIPSLSNLYNTFAYASSKVFVPFRIDL